MESNEKKPLTGVLNMRQGILFLATTLITILIWNLPLDCFGIEGLNFGVYHIPLAFLRLRLLVQLHAGHGGRVW